MTRMSLNPGCAQTELTRTRVCAVIASTGALADLPADRVMPQGIGKLPQAGDLLFKDFAPHLHFPDKGISEHAAPGTIR